MTMFKIALKASASAVLLSAFALPASAVSIQGGGSSLVAPYIAQVYCAHVGGFPPNPHAHCSAIADPSDHGRLFSGNTQQNIADSGFVDPLPDTTNIFDYLISNSGSGQTAILTGMVANLGLPPLPTGFNSAVLDYSDAPLSAAAISAYASGGTIGDLGITLCAPNALTCSSPNIVNPQSTLGASPHLHFGKLIQFPVTIDPVAIGYNPTSLPNAPASGVKLDVAAYCNIFNGKITDWNNANLTALNGGVSLTGGTSLAIHLVGQTDGSGTTSIFTHHLAAVCDAAIGTANNQFNSANLTPGAFKNLPAGLKTLYSLDTISTTEVTDINNHPGSIGYIGADYAIPSITTDADVTAAVLEDSTGAFNSPSAAKALMAFGNVLPPQSNSDGTFNSSVTANGMRNDPAAWVPDTSNPSSGYNIIGTTNIVTYTSSNSTGKAAALVADGAGITNDGLLRWYYKSGNTVPGSISNLGNLGVLPPSWGTAITESFVTGSDGVGNVIH